jgi:hypothetical protein
LLLGDVMATEAESTILFVVGVGLVAATKKNRQTRISGFKQENSRENSQ